MDGKKKGGKKGKGKGKKGKGKGKGKKGKGGSSGGKVDLDFFPLKKSLIVFFVEGNYMRERNQRRER